MPTTKLTKTVVDNAKPRGRAYELRDSITPGFLVKVTPSGRKVFMVCYRTQLRDRRKPAIGRYGELTVDQARAIAKDMLADVRRHRDPSAERVALRGCPTVKEFSARFIADYCEPKNRPTSVRRNIQLLNGYILPAIGHLRVSEVTRPDVAEFMVSMKRTPTNANLARSCLSKMFNVAEMWGVRADGTNPCRHVPRYPEGRRTRLITDEELARIFDHLDRCDAEGLESPFLTHAIRLQFAFAARMSEILNLEWAWIDFNLLTVTWPESKTGYVIKPLNGEALQLLRALPRLQDNPFVFPSITKPTVAMSQFTYYDCWRRTLKAAKVPHAGTHAIRHRAATDIANSGVPLKVGMALTAHKTVAQFMRYVHIEDRAVREAAELVAARRAATIRAESVRPIPPGDAGNRMSDGGHALRIGRL